MTATDLLVDKNKKLAAFCKEQVSSGRFTSLFASCGSLLEGSPPEGELILNREQDLFDLASLTKACVTLPLVFYTLQNRNKDLSHSLQSLLGPSRSSRFHPALLELNLESILSHRSGLPDWLSFWVKCLDGKQCSNRERVYRRLWQVGKGFAFKSCPLYSDVGYILLGLCLEELEERSLNDLFAEFCKHYLGFSHPHFGFAKDLQSLPRLRFAPTGFCQLRKRTLQGEVHDENSSTLEGITGHAGLFSTGDALRLYLQRLFSTSIGKRILNENSSRRLPSFAGPLLGLHQGGGSAQPFGQGQAVGHLGFTGTSFWLIPESKQYGMLLTNRVISGRLAPWMYDVRKNVHHEFSLTLGKHERS